MHKEHVRSWEVKLRSKATNKRVYEVLKIPTVLQKKKIVIIRNGGYFSKYLVKYSLWKQGANKLCSYQIKISRYSTHLSEDTKRKGKQQKGEKRVKGVPWKKSSMQTWIY